MANLGTFLLLAAFVMASGAFAASIAGARRRQNALILGGTGLFHTVTATMIVASVVMLHSLTTGDFSIKYVQHYSNAAQPFFYKLASFWGGLDGSIMFWVLLLSVFGSVAVVVNQQRHRLLIPWVVATIAVVQMFFLFLMVIHHNPFETFLSTPPAQGEGLNPLLQNYYMAIHPPMLYLGFVGMTIPFAFGLAALASGQLDDSWLRAVRRWTMMAWMFLTIGLTLGALWAYEALGWGGYWGWDPVENAGLLPWFTATAFLHSVMVQERRGMLKIWNVSLVIVTFFLTIFGTFMTRSGVVQSVHAFGEDRELAWMFTGFMIFIVAVSFGLVIYRLPLLRARNELDSWASKEAAFLVNNWGPLFSAFFVLFATMFPTLSEAVTGERLTVAAPFFNKWMVPIGFVLLFLSGVGPLLAWRKSTLANMRQQFLWPIVTAVVVETAVLALGLGFWPGGLCFGLCAFVSGTIGQEFLRGALVRRETTGTDLFTALVGLFARSRRRYGGYIVHLGIVLIFFGFAGNAFERNQKVHFGGPSSATEPTPAATSAAEGAAVPAVMEYTLAPYTIRYHQMSVTKDERKQMVTAEVAISRGGDSLGNMYPARWFFFGREQEPTTEVALRRGFAGDLYITLIEYDVAAQSAWLDIHVNPLVNWVWFGVAIMALGTIIALLPERALAYATSRVPEGVVIPSLVLLAALTLGGAPLSAQHAGTGDPSENVGIVPRTTVEKELQEEIICMCGGCGRKRIGECMACSTSAGMRAELHTLVAQGMSKDAIVQHFIKKYGGQQVLAMPIDRGFNRLAWLFPYVTGLAGVGMVGAIAVRWSRRRAGAPTPAPLPAVSSALEGRLDDELRDLD